MAKMNVEDQNLEFNKLIEQNKGILYKVVRTYCQNEIDRQDLLQEIMIQLWQSLPKYNNKFKISTWMYRISINVAISYYRKNANRKSINIPLNEHIVHINDEEKTDKEQQLNLLEQFINELNEFDKALMLFYLDDKSHLEIAEILGISVGNVGTKIGRIKTKLKLQFSHYNL